METAGLTLANQSLQESTEQETTVEPNQEFVDNLNKVKDNCQESSKDAFGVSKEEVLRQLNEAQNIEQRVNLFAKWADKYGLEAILSRTRWLGDGGTSIICTCYLFYQGHKIGLGWREMLKIFGYQAADFLLGSIPIFGNIVDFFFKANKYSKKVFTDHVEKLKKIAIEKGATPEEIESINRTEAQTLKKMDEQEAKTIKMDTSKDDLQQVA